MSLPPAVTSFAEMTRWPSPRRLLRPYIRDVHDETGIRKKRDVRNDRGRWGRQSVAVDTASVDVVGRLKHTGHGCLVVGVFSLVCLGCTGEY